MTWTRFFDMHSGGGQKLDWSHIYVDLPEKEAKRYFEDKFGRDPELVTCECCGEDYSISESETLEKATAYDRKCAYIQPEDYPSVWTSKKHSGPKPRYLEGDGKTGETLPEGWKYSTNYKREGYLTVEEYSKSDGVLIIYTK